MATEYNCYEMVKQIRIALNDYSEEKVQGVDQTGPFLNEYILDKINIAQRYIHSFIMTRDPSIFFKSTTISGVNSTYTLPANFGVLYEFRDDSGYEVFNMRPNQKKLDDSTGSDRFYQRVGNTLVLDKDSVTDTYTLYYYTRPRNLDFGCCVSGSATEIQLATDYAPKTADYYNDMKIENVTQDWVDTIDDYTVNRVCTISETAVTNDYYGIVSELPEPFHFLIPMRAILDIKATHPNSQMPVSNPEMMMFNDQITETMRIYAGTSRDIPVDEIFVDLEPSIGGRGYVQYD